MILKKLVGKPLRLGVLSINCVYSKMNNSISPEYLSSLKIQSYGLQDASNIREPFSRT